MSTHLKLIATLGFALLLPAICVSQGPAQQGPDPRKQLPAVIKYNGDMANILSRLPSVYGRQIGLEVDPRQPRSTVDFYLKDPTLADVLNAISESAPIYQWKEKDDFIEVVPLKGGSPLWIRTSVISALIMPTRRKPLISW